ncbi:efflux RND transporter permease subunit [Bosea vestrisii]|uniref:efflux RND transporter permease subunit n=1 Tax=Bosea vestrisii TaxID=151416 RepID=UPI0024DF9D86|nr:efflux RND transporter permease subunit [Bosea vestrisii]WID97592.1 efflux RND transporter permease subunit [Bosea vestrisii]
MSVSAFCIRHPVATILMSCALILGGLFAWRSLPVAALPRAEFPVVNVSAQLPGASPEIMATSVATPLIKQFATIAGIDSIATTNALGTTSIAIQFALDRDIDAAAADVQAAIARTQRQLPVDMTTPPSYRKFNPADAPILLLALKSEVTPLSKIDAFVQQVLSPTLSTVEGVAQVQIFGSQKYAVRIQVDPTALAARGIGINDLQTAITAANVNTPVGTMQSGPQQLTIEAETQLANAAHFADIIIATRDGRPVRLGDVAKVIDSVENLQLASWYDGSRALVVAVFRQPDANTVQVVDRVRTAIGQMQSLLPPATTLGLLNDRSASIRQAVEDVQFTLGLTIVLVVAVIFLFLRRFTATLIPAVAVPISLIATLGAMYLFDFSIDNISLLGLTLAVGLVVDDAIVMLENIVRHMEEDGLSAFDAALKGSSEIGFTIISISLSLVAVFIPVLLMGGVIGRVFNEFAVVVTVAILASAFVSLTLTPMMCARLGASAAGHGEGKDRLAFLERGFDAVLGAYRAGLDLSLKYRRVVLMIFVASVAASAWLVMTIPKGFFPQEDIGQLQVATEARQDISFDAMSALQQKVEEVFRRSPYVAHVASTIGSGGSSGSLNAGRLFVELKPKAQRPPLQQMLADLRRELAAIPGIAAYMSPVQNLNIGARSSKSQYQFVMQAIDQAALSDWSGKMLEALQHDPLFVDVTTDLQNKALLANLVVDRSKAQSLGISADVLRSSLYSGFGVRQISTIYTTSDSYEVIIEFNPDIEWSNDRLDQVRFRSASGALIPLGTFARIERKAGPLTVNQLGQLPAVTLSFNLPAGRALGEAVQRIDTIKAGLNLPPQIGTSFAGVAKTFEQSLGNQGLLIAGAVLTIYIVLGILYESFIHPLTILTGLPAAALGALLTLKLFGLDLSVIAVIGLLMLIGIVKKNAIMMIDVALELQRAGEPPETAIREACLRRFRPIIMTTLAAILGALPIAIGAGASAELRQPLGLAVVGGLIVSQVLTLFITPVIFLAMEGLSRRLGGSKTAAPAMVEPPRAAG